MGWNTHEVSNQFDELQDYNLYATDTALQEAVTRHGGAPADQLPRQGLAQATTSACEYRVPKSRRHEHPVKCWFAA